MTDDREKRTEALIKFIQSKKQKFFQHLADGNSVDDFIENNKEEIFDILFPEKFLVTIELRAPKDGTLAEAINIVESSCALAKVVHCEKMETTK